VWGQKKWEKLGGRAAARGRGLPAGTGDYLGTLKNGGSLRSADYTNSSVGP